MSVQALSWVLEDCPDLPKHLVACMIGLANHADPHGKGSYPSQELLAWYTRKDERTVRRDLDQCQELELIERGDQRMVLHLAPDKRPVVWNLRMDRRRDPRPAPGRPGRPRDPEPPPAAQSGQPSGEPVDKTGGTPTSTGFPDRDETVQGGVGNRGDVHVPPLNRGDVDDKSGGRGRPNRGDVGVPRTVPGTVIEPPPPAALSTAAPSGGSTREEEFSRDWKRALDAAAALLADVVATVPAAHVPSGGQLRTLMDLAARALTRGWTRGALAARLLTGDLTDNHSGVYAILRHRLGTGLPERPPAPRPLAAVQPPTMWVPWCQASYCDEKTRQLLDDEGRPLFERDAHGGPDPSAPVMCPDCSPAATVPAMGLAG